MLPKEARAKMIRTWLWLGLTSALAPFPFTSLAAEPQVQTSGCGSPAVSDSRVGNIDIKCGERNPHREKLASAMVVMNKELNTAIDQGADLGGGYIALYDPGDPPFHVEADKTKMYVFFAGQSGMAEEHVPEGHECEFQEGYSVLGAVLTGRVANKLHLTGRLLPRDSSLLQAMCAGLGARAAGQEGRSADKALTNFDVTAADLMDFSIITLMPGEVYGASFEERTARAYWSGLISNSDPVSLGRQIMQQHGMEDLIEDIKKDGEIKLAADVGPNNGWGPLQPVSPIALSTFGEPMQEMDKKWSDYLGSAAVRIGGQLRPVADHGRVSRLLSRFRARELSSQKFWVELPAGTELSGSVNCLATVFTVDNDYGSVGDLPSYRRCAAAVLKAERAQ